MCTPYKKLAMIAKGNAGGILSVKLLFKKVYWQEKINFCLNSMRQG
jgi:hypothetical protein